MQQSVGILLQFLGGVNMIMSLIFNNVPQSIIGAVIYYHGLKVVYDVPSEESE